MLLRKTLAWTMEERHVRANVSILTFNVEYARMAWLLQIWHSFVELWHGGTIVGIVSWQAWLYMPRFILEPHAPAGIGRQSSKIHHANFERGAPLGPMEHDTT